MQRLKKNYQSKNLCIKIQTVSAFFDITKVSDIRCKNPDVNTTQEVCHVIYIFFGSFRKGITVPSFIMLDMGFLSTPPPPHSLSNPERPILNWVKAFAWNYNYLYFLDLKKLSILLRLQVPAKQTTVTEPLYLAET